MLATFSLHSSVKYGSVLAYANENDYLKWSIDN